MALEKNAKNSVDRRGKKYLGFQENEYSKINIEYTKTEKKSMGRTLNEE